MTKLADRIQEILDAGHSQTELARAAKVTKGTSNQWLNGQIKSIKLEYAQGIEALTGYSAEWLVTGSEPKMVADRLSKGWTAAPLHSVQSDPRQVDADEILELISLYKEAVPTIREHVKRILMNAKKLPNIDSNKAAPNSD